MTRYIWQKEMGETRLRSLNASKTSTKANNQNLKTDLLGFID